MAIITAKVNKDKLNSSVKILANDIGNSVKKKALTRWRTNITATMEGTYKKHARTSQQGFRNLSQMFSRKSTDNKDGIAFEFFVNPAKTKSGEDIDKWESIAHQTEFGETRDGSKQIRPNKAKILAIPVHPKAKGKSPTEFVGRWINPNGKALFIEDQKKGQKVNRRPGRRRKVAPVNRKARRTSRLSKKGPKPRVLFVGTKSVNVRRATPYWKPTVDEMFGGGNNSKAIKRLRVVLSEELNIDESDIKVV
tara:strand:- start:1131 stop:1883 length:753 start_codon:yes stop_codon:yes gene_type:complete